MPALALHNNSEGTGHQPYYVDNSAISPQQQQHPQQHHLQQHHPQQHHPHSLPHSLPHSSPSSNLDPALNGKRASPPRPSGSADEDEDEGDNDDGNQHDTPSPNNGHHPGVKRARACDSCRNLKVRCDQDQIGQVCKRCAKARRECITTPPTRKRQRKADSRVAELERKINALTASLAQSESGLPPNMRRHTSFAPQQNPYTTVSPPEAAFRYPPASQDWAARYPDPPPGYGPAHNLDRAPEPKRRKIANDSSQATIPEDMDAIHRDLAEVPEIRRGPRRGPPDYSYINHHIDNLVAPDIAERIFMRYVNEICPHFPAVPLNPGATAREVREKKPLLFLAILAGSSHGSAEQLVPEVTQQGLTHLLKDQFAEIIWRKGEKSLEIVQALQVGVLWYRPPVHYEQHNFYMMVNCAAVMALDLGLGRRATPTKLNPAPFQRCHPKASSIDSRRTFLVCYYLCMSITMVLRRPILLRWTKFMDESVEILESSSEALPSDKTLCQHVKMAHIGENISVKFSMDDPCAEVAISDPEVMYTLKRFEQELSQLKKDIAPMSEVDPALRLAEHVTNLYIHEIALHHNQSPADFQPPFSDPFVSGVGRKDTIGPDHMSALVECLQATHGILETILNVPIDILMTLPVIFCVRAIYAIVCLMKMWVSVDSSGDVGNVIKMEQLNIELYTERLVNMFSAIVSRDSQSPHGKFFFVAQRLQERFSQIKETASKTEADSKEHVPRSTNQPLSKSRPSRTSTTNQTPLHLLSEVAMGSSSASSSHPQQQPALPTQPMHQPMQGWYDGPVMGGPQQQDVIGMPQGNFNFDPNFDFTSFDLNTGSDADLSALFIPDAVIWGYGGAPQGFGNPY